MRVVDVKNKLEAGEPLTEEEKVVAKQYNLKVSVGPAEVPYTTSKLTAINEFLRIFKFTISKTADGYFIEDCRKVPPKRINGIAYKTEEEAINRMGGRILGEFEERTTLYKLASVKYPDLNGELKKSKKWHR